MADTFKGIITADGKKRQLPYGSVLDKPVSDETLSIRGAFADSKVVGDKFEKANAETASIKEDLIHLYDAKNVLIADYKSANFENGKYLRYDNGETENSTMSSCTGYIDVTGLNEIIVTLNITSSLGLSGYAWYDSDKKYITGRQYTVRDVKEYELRELSVPSNASYFRTSFRNDIIDKFALYTSDYRICRNNEYVSNAVDKYDTISYCDEPDYTDEVSEFGIVAGFEPYYKTIRYVEIESSVSRVKKYSVKKGEPYLIVAYGEDSNNSRPFAIFSSENIELIKTAEIANSSNTKYEKIVTNGNQTNPQYRKIIYIAPENGYIFVNTTTQFDKCGLYSPKKCNNGLRFREIPIEWEDGSFYGNGEDYDSLTHIRSQKIETRKDCLYLYTFPSEFHGDVNRSVNGKRENLKFGARYSSFSFSNYEGFIRFSINKHDNSNLSVNDLDKNLLDIRVYEIKKLNDFVSISKFDNKYDTDIVVDGTNDQRVIQALMNNIDEGQNVILYPGDYNLNEFYEINESGQYTMLSFDEQAYYYSKNKKYSIKGTNSTRSDDKKSVSFNVSYDDELNPLKEYSVILTPRPKPELDTDVLSYIILELSNISIIGNFYQKAITVIDATHSKANMIDNVFIRGDGQKKGLSTFPTKPNEKCVGIRVGYGSNNGVQNYVKHCLCYYAGIGFSVCGEHYVLEDCLAHHCYVGFAFGDRLTRGNYEHPNIMIGCSIEGCYRLMTLSRYGETVESNAEYSENTLICIGLSTETTWNIPLDEIEEGKPTSKTTLPILEILKGAYRGRIELDYPSVPFSSGSGDNFKYTVYTSNGILSN